MHPEKITVWWGLWAGGNSGPYFFKDAANRNVTVNGERYREPKMQELDLHDMWFQQDGAKTVNWPPRSCDLTPLDYFLLGYAKAHVYTDKPASIDALEDNIEAFIRDIPTEIFAKSMPKLD